MIRGQTGSFELDTACRQSLWNFSTSDGAVGKSLRPKTESGYNSVQSSHIVRCVVMVSGQVVASPPRALRPPPCQRNVLRPFPSTCQLSALPPLGLAPFRQRRGNCHELNTSPYVIPANCRVPRALYQFVPCPAHTLSLIPARPDSSSGPVRSELPTRHRTHVSVPRVATCVLMRSSLRHINGTRHPTGLPRPDW